MKISVIIPTLLKNTVILKKLLNVLDLDDSVSEIIIINNSSIDYKTEIKKVKIITTNQNLFVNPSWNLGVQNAKEEYFALFNDDLLVCENFCSMCIAKIRDLKDFGCMGIYSDSVINTKSIKIPMNTDMQVEQDVGERCLNWGIIIFGRKSIYTPIPENIKIWCGDDFIRYMTLKNNYKIYRLKGANIFHLGSLSSNNKALEKIKFYDIIFYSAIDQNFIKTEVYNRYKNKVDYYFDYGDCIYKSLKKYKIIAIISFLIIHVLKNNHFLMIMS